VNLEAALPAADMEAIRAPFAAAGATAIDVPVIQPLGVLLDLTGEAMRARLFVVQADGGEEACLRPDFTIAIARAHIAEGAVTGRYIYEGKAFRAAPRGSHRAEEFLQIGLEAYGGGRSATADAEIVDLAWRASAAGGRADLSLLLGDASLFAAFVGALGLNPALAARMARGGARATTSAAPPAERQGDRIAALLAGLPEAEACAVLEDLWSLSGIQPVGGRSAAEIVHRLAARSQGAAAALTPAQAEQVEAFLAIEGPPREALAAMAKVAETAGANIAAALADWAARLDGFAAKGVPDDRMTLSTRFGRAFSYYDGFLFEVRSAALGEDRPVAAGGRYDGLTKRLGAAKASDGAVGCMVRPARAWSKSEPAE
jgi:ATP phosphoribosyltransferase regulatory subunit